MGVENFDPRRYFSCLIIFCFCRTLEYVLCLCVCEREREFMYMPSPYLVSVSAIVRGSLFFSCRIKNWLLFSATWILLNLKALRYLNQLWTQIQLIYITGLPCEVNATNFIGAYISFQDNKSITFHLRVI